MLKKYWYIIIISIIILAIILIKFKSSPSMTENNKFQIEDTSLITKIFLADRNGKTITLKKKQEKWVVNDQFFVREDAINTILLTANKIRIKKPVSKASFNNVIKYIATTGIVVEFSNNNEIIRSYTIGSNTADHLGNYMLLKDSETPFVVHIPSFNGFLSPRYGIQGNSLDITNWRSTTIFNISFESIKHIKYTDFLNPENSYFLKTKPFKLMNFKNNVIQINKNKVLKLINSFENLNCETFKKEKSVIDSLPQIEELIVNSDTLRTYKILDKKRKNQKDNFTVKRKFATLNNGDLMLIQDYVFNKVLININELTD